jgi:hypothetical protein
MEGFADCVIGSAAQGRRTAQVAYRGGASSASPGAHAPDIDTYRDQNHASGNDLLCVSMDIEQHDAVRDDAGKGRGDDIQFRTEAGSGLGGYKT